MQRCIVTIALAAGVFASVAFAQDEKPQNFVGGLKQSDSTGDAEAKPVRNDVAQPGEEVLTLRYFKIKKGTFPEFLKASQQGVWPFFEKLGARVVGMWKVIYPEVSTDPEIPDYDEVWLMTRYASVEHWAASREPQKHGGNGPDWEACRKALETRRALTLETRVQFLQGSTWQSPPAFLPGLDEKYERAD
jgi:hypothetical protein